jgi:hypothetical protein
MEQLRWVNIRHEHILATAVRAAVRNGWVVENNNRLRKPHTGGINGVQT